jgi:hypothetical protein
MPYKSCKPNAQLNSIINKVSNIKDMDFGWMHRGLPSLQQCWHPRNLTLVYLRTPLGLAPLEIPISAPRDLAHMQKMATIT